MEHFFWGGCLFGFLFCATNAPFHQNKNPDFVLPAAGTEAVCFGYQAISGHPLKWSDIGNDNLGAGASALTLKISF